MSAALNTASFGIIVILGFGVGFFAIEYLTPDPEHKTTPTDSNDVQVSLNAAILYATIALVLSGVVTEWPPEGQTMLPYLEDVIFFGTVLVAAVIVGRVTRLIWKVEQNYGA